MYGSPPFIKFSEKYKWNVRTVRGTMGSGKLEFDGGYFMNMKKVFQVICCAAGAGMIGFFANQLNTVVGCVFFTLGVALLVGSIILVSKKDKEDK